MKVRPNSLSQASLELQWIRKAPSIRQNIEISEVSYLVSYSTYSQMSCLSYRLALCPNPWILCISWLLLYSRSLTFPYSFLPVSFILLSSSVGFTPHNYSNLWKPWLFVISPVVHILIYCGYYFTHYYYCIAALTSPLSYDVLSYRILCLASFHY